MDQVSTRIDHLADTGIVDIGYHYESDGSASTPTPTATPTTPESTPTSTPDPQYTPVILTVPQPYTTIQSALNAACYSDTVLVDHGTYCGPGNTNLNLHGKRIHLLGYNAVIDCEYNSRAFRLDAGESRHSIIEGFTIVNGFASWEADTDSRYCGGGILCINGSSPSIQNCIIYGCDAQSAGGAICCRGNSEPLLSEITIIACNASNGGGIAADYATPELHRCVLSLNTAGNGGAIHSSNSSLSMDQCVLHDSASTLCAGGLYAYQSAIHLNETVVEFNASVGKGGGIYGYRSFLHIYDCRLSSNVSDIAGGGMYLHRSQCELLTSLVEDNSIDGDESKGGGICSLISELFLRDSFIRNNEAENGGGVYSEENTETVLFDCIVADNRSETGGGLYSCINDSFQVMGSLIQGNRAENGSGMYLFETDTNFVNVLIAFNRWKQSDACRKRRRIILPGIITDYSELYDIRQLRAMWRWHIL